MAVIPTPQITPIISTPTATPIEDLVRRLKLVLPNIEIYNSTNKAAY
jgi:hypothetical protein